MFTDVVSSAILAQVLGDRAWSVRINSHFADAQRIVEAQSGCFVKTLEDGRMSSFTPVRATLCAGRTIQAALAEELEEPRLNVRIGLRTGDGRRLP